MFELSIAKKALTVLNRYHITACLSSASGSRLIHQRGRYHSIIILHKTIIWCWIFVLYTSYGSTFRRHKAKMEGRGLNRSRPFPPVSVNTLYFYRPTNKTKRLLVSEISHKPSETFLPLVNRCRNAKDGNVWTLCLPALCDAASFSPEPFFKRRINYSWRTDLSLVTCFVITAAPLFLFLKRCDAGVLFHWRM